MNIDFSKISFKQVLSSNNKQNNSSVKLSESNKHRRNEAISDPIDNRFADRRTKNGIVKPSSYDDCYERMSFENDNDVDIWNDSYYEDDVHVAKRIDYQDELFGIPASQRHYFYQQYDYNDVPLADSLVRKEIGLYETPSPVIDGDITYEGEYAIKHLNYFENIVPSALHCKPETDDQTISHLAHLATMLSNTGHSQHSIVRALERCTISDDEKGTSYAEPRLFEFLVKHPNLRPDAVSKNSTGVECFDKAYVDCFSILNEHYFDKENDIRQALNLCKVNKNGFSFVDRDLCELVGLLRQRTAQGLTPKTQKTYGYQGRIINQKEKYCDRNVPLSENDILLINKIKQSGIVDTVLLGIAKELLSENKETVASVLENIDGIAKAVREAQNTSASNDLSVDGTNNQVGEKQEQLNEQFVREQDIKLLLAELREKPGKKTEAHVEKIEEILYAEFEALVSNKKSLKDNSLLFEVVSVLNEQNQLSPHSISVILNKIFILSSRIEGFDMHDADKYINAVTYVNDKGERLVDKSLNALLTDMCLYSRKVDDAAVGVMNKIKALSGNDRYQMIEIVKHMTSTNLGRRPVSSETILNNMDEVLKYHKKASEIDKALCKSKSKYASKISMPLRYELRATCRYKDFSCKNSELLSLAEKIVAGEVDYQDVKDKFNARSSFL